ncbi:nucleoprotein/polynucleotide-associated enzyme [Escherichia coli]|uniref:Nucleoprotein/polynucleotide-associated enzyme n=1 Tax=Escherichia coli TaxID=562 RepID=A0A377KBC0_ECOLX|nr:nucleoprotein/polynucleotide-associated enzyme [Escherichia coli]
MVVWRLARLLVDNNNEGEYAIIPASVADKIAQRDASSIVLHSALSAEEQDEDDPYADFKVPDDLIVVNIDKPCSDA